MTILGNSINIINNGAADGGNLGSFATAPTANSVGDTYFNTTDSGVYQWDGTSWVPLYTINHLGSFATAPSPATAGNTYYNTTTNTLMVYNGTTWLSTGPDGSFVGSGTTAPAVGTTPNGSTFYNTSTDGTGGLYSLVGGVWTLQTPEDQDWKRTTAGLPYPHLTADYTSPIRHDGQVQIGTNIDSATKSLAVGSGNTTSGVNSVAVGDDNVVLGRESIAVGNDNVVNGYGSSIIGGADGPNNAIFTKVYSTINGDGSSIIGGCRYVWMGANILGSITGDGSAIVGGYNGASGYNTINGHGCIIIGGGASTITANNIATDYRNGIFSSYTSSITGTSRHSNVFGGNGNVLTDSYSSVIVGGQNNTIFGSHNAIVGGIENTTTGSYNFIGGCTGFTTGTITSTRRISAIQSYGNNLVADVNIDVASNVVSIGMGPTATGVITGTQRRILLGNADLPSDRSYVGIGINTPTEFLDVLGNTKTSGAFIVSDKTHKQSIEYRDEATDLDRVLQLNPVSYQWSDKYDSEYISTGRKLRHEGIIAQELQAIIPNAVKESYTPVEYEEVDVYEDIEQITLDKEGNEVKEVVKTLVGTERTGKISKPARPTGELAVEPMALISTLIGAVKAQQKQIDELKTLISKPKK